MSNLQYIVKADSPYMGSVQSILINGIVAYSNGLNFEQYQKSKNENFKLISKQELEKLQREYRSSLISEFTEITEDRYYEMLSVLPPKRHHFFKGAEIFFVSECYALDLYNCYVQCNDKYFTALRPISDTSEVLTAFLDAH